MKHIDVYGADWCEDTAHTLEHLQELGVPFRYLNIEQDPGAAQWVKDQNGGKQKTPTVDVQGEVLSVPRDSELDRALKAHGIVA